jgi:sec-independent protein translocase protein TatA
MFGLEGWHIVIIVVLALLLFGAPKLPGLARSMGQSLRIFKSEVRQMKDDDPKAADSTDGTVEGKIVDPDHRDRNL